MDSVRAINSARRDNPALQGKVVLEVTIAPSGDVTASQAYARLPVADFARFYAGRGIWLPA